MDFSRRHQWDSMFEDGVVVEAIDLGEELVLSDNPAAGPATPRNPRMTALQANDPASGSSTPDRVIRNSNDLDSFLETVDLAGGM